jgi:hypothetical protein
MPEDPMGCGVSTEELSALLDGELDALRAEELRGHVTGCEPCASRLAAFERAGALLSALPARPVPNDLRARLQARIDADDAHEAPPVRVMTRTAPPARRRWLGSRALATAAAVAAAVALYWAFTAGDRAGPGREIETPPIAREDVPPVPTRAPAALPEPDPAPELPSVPESSVPQIAEATPAPTPLPEAPDADFDPVPAEEIAVALELETIEDLDVIANLELLEALVALGEGTG